MVLLGCGSANVASIVISKRLRCSPPERRRCRRHAITVFPVTVCAAIPGPPVHVVGDLFRSKISLVSKLHQCFEHGGCEGLHMLALRRALSFFVRYCLFREEP